jgi:hypothetical protein
MLLLLKLLLSRGSFLRLHSHIAVHLLRNLLCQQRNHSTSER